MPHSSYEAAVAYVHTFIRGPGDAGPGGVTEELAAHELLALRERRLAHLRFFLNRLGNPERAFRSVHVGGTSGKGSTAAFAHSILHAAGKRSGLHTSPYLQVPIEKLVLGDRYLSPSSFAALVEHVKPIVAEIGVEGQHDLVAYGELWVALTFVCFAQQQVEFGVVEVGAGGRWDYTNVLPSEVAIITSIGYDHVRSLGPTLADIAQHKAGIVKPGKPTIVGPMDDASLRIITKECAEQNAPMWRYGREFQAEPAAGGRFHYRGPSWRLNDVRPSLSGMHQSTNAALAIAAIEALGCLDATAAEPAIQTALATTRFPGRFEIMQERPTVILDGAHNEQKTRALAVTLRDRLQLARQGRLTLVFGALASKSSGDMLAALAPLGTRVITTAPTVYQKTSADPADLATLAARYCRDVVVEPDPLRAIDRAITESGPDDTICAAGSLYLVGEIRERWVPSGSLLDAAESGLPPP